MSPTHHDLAFEILIMNRNLTGGLKEIHFTCLCSEYINEQSAVVFALILSVQSAKEEKRLRQYCNPILLGP